MAKVTKSNGKRRLPKSDTDGFDRAALSYRGTIAEKSSFVVGIDQADIASPPALRIGTKMLGKSPTFWGRFFKGPGNTSPIQYQPTVENTFFSQRGIRVLPIARQTNNVGRSERLGYVDGQRNGAAVLAAFGANHLARMADGIRVFLDVERYGPMSPSYYEGWSKGLIDAGRQTMIDFSDEIDMGVFPRDISVTFRPCVYGHHSADRTWQSLGTAISGGAVCDGAWIVFMNSPARFPIWPWRSSFTSRHMPSSVPVLACQRILDYSQDGVNLDYNLANPAHEADFLNTLVLPA
ncbi:hypothetical protein [Mesorhizobium sophorae]|uniref:hypothetical protein n=1 Tax=Mesorhizobium sophorae TaxID=1300294 RepID=UPI000BA3DD28|nr:hypothetical protein [Mesorhizobium sophorae]